MRQQRTFPSPFQGEGYEDPVRRSRTAGRSRVRVRALSYEYPSPNPLPRGERALEAVRSRPFSTAIARGALRRNRLTKCDCAPRKGEVSGAAASSCTTIARRRPLLPGSSVFGWFRHLLRRHCPLHAGNPMAVRHSEALEFLHRCVGKSTGQWTTRINRVVTRQGLGGDVETKGGPRVQASSQNGQIFT